jgi:phosphoglycerate dehydrogenase-like enzyme
MCTSIGLAGRTGAAGLVQDAGSWPVLAGYWRGRRGIPLTVLLPLRYWLTVDNYPDGPVRRMTSGAAGPPAVAGTAPVPAEVTVLIATPMEAAQVDRIAAADSRVSVIYEPALLPVPRYPADHSGQPRELTPAELARWSQLRSRADVSFDFDWQDPGQMAVNCPRLRWVQGTSAGLGGFLARTGLADTKIVITTAAGVHGVPLAEFTLLGLLYFTKDVPRLRRLQHGHQWELHHTRQLAGTRAVLVGLGGIGREVARLLAAAGLEVVGAGRPGRSYQVPGVTSYVADTDLDAALPGADALILACPLTERTRHLIGARQLSLLRQGAVVVNVSRGPVIDERALAAALRSGHLGGACLDVFETEPLPADSPLWDLPGVLVSPHSASTVEAENRLLTDLFIDNLRRWLAGAPLRNVYDHAAGY